MDNTVLYRLTIKTIMLWGLLAALFLGIQCGSLLFAYYLLESYGVEARIYTTPFYINNALILLLGIVLGRAVSIAWLCQSKNPPLAGESDMFTKLVSEP